MTPPAELDSDPRPPPTDTPVEPELAAPVRPAVARGPSSAGLLGILGGAGALGLLAFVVLATSRPARVPETSGALTNAVRPGTTATTATAPANAPADFSQLEAAGRGQLPTPALAGPPVVVVPPTAPAPSALPPMTPPAAVLAAAGPSPQALAATAATELAQRQKAPALVVDLAEPSNAAGAAGGPVLAGAAGAAVKAGAAGDKGDAKDRPALTGDEQFAARLEGAAEPERVRASMLRNQSAAIAQGTIIPGVLETALNSDLPGFARAVVSRDVRSFDGSAVLIPRGSHVIGQYRSGVALGASRAFVIWSRIIRPDGASVQIASSGTDQLGRAGLEGEVNRHFFQRFGGAILLSVVNAGITSLTRSPSTNIVIGSSQEATGLASSAFSPTNISPTIKVAQGTPIRIFVARDLDFSTVEGLAR